MKILALIFLSLGLVMFFSVSTAQAQTSEWKEVVPSAPSGGGSTTVNVTGVSCTVICNGTCPTPPTGWTLAQSTGASGGEEYDWEYSGPTHAAAGRCLRQAGTNSISAGTERMCCFFKD